MAAYGTLVTELGIQLIARYLSEGGKLEISEFAVGDGGGEEYRPTADMTGLRRERWRGAVSSVEVSETSPNVILIEAVVPGDVGGFTIREAGAFDARGNLIGIMNTPRTEKITSEDGALTEQYFQMYLSVSSTEAIALRVDPSVVTAKREDVERLREQTEENLAEHNASSRSHQDLREGMSDHANHLSRLENRLIALENAILSDIQDNKTYIFFTDPDAVELIAGNYNAGLQRIECTKGA